MCRLRRRAAHGREREIQAGRASLLISRRFGAVREVDLIAVLTDDVII
ncbi:hypothetical protein ABT120_42980 [Nonomuraea angiospora]